MKLFWKVLVLGALLTTILSNYSFAQDKQLLARVAYEEAEKAFEAGKLSTSYEELKKVDEHLGKVMPKTQFLRVQIWKTWAEEDGQYLEYAIRNSKVYLAMDKTFDLPEEKKLEVTRWLVKLEKDKVAYDKAQVAADKAKKVEAIRKAKAVAFIDSLYKVYHYTPRMTEDALIGHYREELKKLKRKTYKGAEIVTVLYEKGAPTGEGLDDVDIANNKVIEFAYVIKYDESGTKAVKTYFDGLFEYIKTIFPARDLYTGGGNDYISITTNDTLPDQHIVFSYSLGGRKGNQPYIVLKFYTRKF